MSRIEKRHCICDMVYRYSHTECEPSTKYLCDILNSEGRDATFHFNGEAVTMSDAAKIATRLLRLAEYPLITGLTNIGIGSQQAATNIAKATRGVVDSGWDSSTFESHGTLARVGAVSATFGEVVARSDVVIIAEGDLWKTHARFAQQLSNGNKKLIYLGSKENMNSSVSWDDTILVPKDQLGFFLTELEAAVVGQAFAGNTSKRSSDLEHLLDVLQNSLYTSFIVCDRFAKETVNRIFDSAFDSLTTAAIRQNKNSRCVLLKLDGNGNDLAAENLLTWSFGFPRAVDLALGFPQSYCDEYSTQNIVARQECDLLLSVDRPPMESMADSTCSFLNSIPTIIFSWDGTDSKPQDSHGQGVQLEIRNLSRIPDDFLRSDDVSIRLNDELIEDSSSAANLGQFLQLISAQLES